jgi:hypothetical protein
MHNQPTPSYFPTGFWQTVKYGSFSVSADLTPRVSTKTGVGLGRFLTLACYDAELARIDLGVVSPDYAEGLLEGLKQYVNGADKQDPPSFFEGIISGGLQQLTSAAKPGIVDCVREQGGLYKGVPTKKPAGIYESAQNVLDGLRRLGLYGITITPPEGRHVFRQDGR